jgi:hypothetical protein
MFNVGRPWTGFLCRRNQGGLRSLTAPEKGLKEIFGQQRSSSLGIALVSDDETLFSISDEVIQGLPALWPRQVG